MDRSTLIVTIRILTALVVICLAIIAKQNFYTEKEVTEAVSDPIKDKKDYELIKTNIIITNERGEPIVIYTLKTKDGRYLLASNYYLEFNRK